MIIALWIIAACQIFGAVCNLLHIKLVFRDDDTRQNAYSEFVKSLKATDREFVKQMLEEFDKDESNPG